MIEITPEIIEKSSMFLVVQKDGLFDYSFHGGPEQAADLLIRIASAIRLNEIYPKGDFLGRDQRVFGCPNGHGVMIRDKQKMNYYCLQCSFRTGTQI